MQEYARRHTLTGLIRLVEQFADLTKGFDSQIAQRIAIETLLIRISRRAVEMSVDTVIEKIMQLSEGGARLPVARDASNAAPGPPEAPPAQQRPAAPDLPRPRRAESVRERPEEEPRQSPPPPARASAAEVRDAMKDPHVSKVVDVFKGRVVEVKRDGKPAH
jgi:hypothetical protein